MIYVNNKLIKWFTGIKIIKINILYIEGIKGDKRGNKFEKRIKPIEEH